MSNLDKILSTNAGFDALALRIPAAIIFIAHGAQKFFAWFGGYGLKGTGQWMASIGLEPGFQMALMLAVTMLVAIFSLHFVNGLFMSANGYEFALALLAISVALMVSGAGRFSVDSLLNKKLS